MSLAVHASPRASRRGCSTAAEPQQKRARTKLTTWFGLSDGPGGTGLWRISWAASPSRRRGPGSGSSLRSAEMSDKGIELFEM